MLTGHSDTGSPDGMPVQLRQQSSGCAVLGDVQARHVESMNRYPIAVWPIAQRRGSRDVPAELEIVGELASTVRQPAAAGVSRVSPEFGHSGPDVHDDPVPES